MASGISRRNEGRVPLSVQFFKIFLQFFTKFMPNNTLVFLPKVDSPLENPGFTTDGLIYIQSSPFFNQKKYFPC